MRPRKLRIILMFLVTPACFCSGQTQSGSATGLEGVITVAPIHPGPIRAGSDIPNSAPLANAAFAVENEKGMVTSFTADDQGRFRVSLAPGHYAVSMKERRFPHCGPFEVDVVAGKMTKVEWGCDTGMR